MPYLSWYSYDRIWSFLYNWDDSKKERKAPFSLPTIRDLRSHSQLSVKAFSSWTLKPPRCVPPSLYSIICNLLDILFYILMDSVSEFKFFSPLTILCLYLATFFPNIYNTFRVCIWSSFTLNYPEIVCPLHFSNHPPNAWGSHCYPEWFTFKIVNNSTFNCLVQIFPFAIRKKLKFPCLAYRVLKHSGNYLPFQWHPL